MFFIFLMQTFLQFSNKLLFKEIIYALMQLFLFYFRILLTFLFFSFWAEDSAITSDIIDEVPEGAVGGEDDSSVFLAPTEESSGNLQQSSSLEKQDSSDISEDFVKLQLEGDTPEPLSEASICEDDP